MGKKYKNLIIITSDEMRGDAPSFMGNPDCKTPNLDKFAQKGVVFENHFTVHGKCVPARIAMVTGRYSHTDGFRTVNETNLLPPDAPNILGTLKEHGYETAVLGHNHVWSTLFASNKKSGGYADYHSWTEGYEEFFDEEIPVPKPGPNSVKPIKDKGNDYIRVKQAIDFITKTRDKSKPFYLHLNIGKPHPPYYIEEPYFSMYDRKKIKPYPHILPENAPLQNGNACRFSNWSSIRCYRKTRTFRKFYSAFLG